MMEILQYLQRGIIGNYKATYYEHLVLEVNLQDIVIGCIVHIIRKIGNYGSLAMNAWY